MAGCRFWIACSIATSLALTVTNITRSQTETPQVIVSGPATQVVSELTSKSKVTKVYSLSDLGDDPNLCKWIAETIPQMVQPGSWCMTEGQKSLCYYAPGKMMVICHTPAVHAQVEDFLQGIRKSNVQRMKTDAQVRPAQFVPERMPPVGPVHSSQAYPVPDAMKAPKHLFHFIIRYEGEGIIDSNVVKFAEKLTGANKDGSCPTPITAYVPTPGTTLPAAHYLPSPPQYVPPTGAIPATGPGPRMPTADGQPSMQTTSNSPGTTLPPLPPPAPIAPSSVPPLR